MSIIDKVIEKIKYLVHQSWFDDILWALVVIVISFGSFSLGIEYERERFLEQNPVSIQRNENIGEIWEQYKKEKSETSYFFGSKNGSTYYTRGCKAGNRIAEENKIFFSTSKEAEDLGYMFSKQC